MKIKEFVDILYCDDTERMAHALVKLTYDLTYSKASTETRNLQKETQRLLNVDKQRVVCAAIKHINGHVIVGIRHFSPDMLISAEMAGFSTLEEFKEQGFVDQWGNFLSREEAYDIAVRQGQFRRRDEKFKSKQLFSEDLY